MSNDFNFSKIDNKVKITLHVELGRSMLENENKIQDALNAAGSMLTASALDHLDTDGSPIRLGNVKLTSKGKIAKEYETPHGKISVDRHVYQSSDGGKIFCPLDFEARIINSSTPRFANIVSFKFANTSVSGVVRDLQISNNRAVSNNFVHETSAAVANIIEEKEELWTYESPELQEQVTSIGLSLDGTCVNIRQDGWKQAMVGTIALYNSNGERLFTLYLGESPESGKSRFHERFHREIMNFLDRYSTAKVVGIADGAKDNWSYLSRYTQSHCLDFYHASEYVSRVAHAAFRDDKKREKWLSDNLHALKHEIRYSEKLIEQMNEMLESWDLSLNRKDEIKVCRTYFTNNKNRMSYAEHVKNKLPIGSGVVEAGCKILVKERLCGSGMKWNKDGCSRILLLRSLALTDGRWDQLWQKMDRFGFAA